MLVRGVVARTLVTAAHTEPLTTVQAAPRRLGLLASVATAVAAWHRLLLHIRHHGRPRALALLQHMMQRDIGGRRKASNVRRVTASHAGTASAHTHTASTDGAVAPVPPNRPAGVCTPLLA
jgi:hypothetical protein